MYIILFIYFLLIHGNKLASSAELASVCYFVQQSNSMYVINGNVTCARGASLFLTCMLMGWDTLQSCLTTTCTCHGMAKKLCNKSK